MKAVHKPTVTDADVERLEAERDRADRLYNQALTALDQALVASKPLRLAGQRPDASGLERLSRAWQVIPVDPVPLRGWRGRLGAFVWRLVGPMLQRQQEFNAAVVDQLNLNTAWANEAVDAFAAFNGALEGELRGLTQMQSRLIAYLQQVTFYVDTKDRYAAGLLWHELRLRTEGLAAGLSAIGDQLLKGQEHDRVFEQRLDARLAEGLVRLARASQDGRTTRGRTEGPTGVSDAAESSAASVESQFATDDQAKTYAGFEDLYRGTPEEIRERLAEYVPLFAGATDVLDVGCGRGELLAAMREQAISARGVDVNPEMVARCRAQGLDVVQGESIAFLGSLPDASLGGLIATQVIEHLEPEQLLRLLDLARTKLRPGARIVLETINPACWAAFFLSYVRDLTHVRPVHPDTLRYLLVARGFRNADIRFSAPYPADAKLHPLPLTLVSESPGLAQVVETFNQNVATLNGQLFTYYDYAAIAENV